MPSSTSVNQADACHALLHINMSTTDKYTVEDCAKKEGPTQHEVLKLEGYQTMADHVNYLPTAQVLLLPEYPYAELMLKRRNSALEEFSRCLLQAIKDWILAKIEANSWRARLDVALSNDRNT